MAAIEGGTRERTAERGREAELSFATRAAWLSYIGGYKQEEIAERLGVSRVKVNRLIALAHRESLIRVFVEGSPAECVALEDSIAAAYGLDFCIVAPSLGEDDLPLRSLGIAGARYLHKTLERSDLRVVGVGHGRTLAEVVESLPRLPRADVKFVSLLGSLTRNAAANPFDVIHRLAAKTGGESYFMPVPFFADSLDDKRILLAQQSVRDVFVLARSAELFLVGVGEVGPKAHMLETGMITKAEFADLKRAGAVGEILGHFVDAAGRPVEAELNQRSLGLRIEDLKDKQVVAIAGGRGKARAVDAVLRSNVVRGLIIDEATAQRLAGKTGGKRAAAE